MLESLKIESLILIEQAEILFGKGLNILTGETGSGKSAILAAIRLLCGEKADPNLIKKGRESAIVTGRIFFSQSIAEVCREEDLEPPRTGEPALIRREILRSGKSRAFFNDQQIGISLLKKLLAHAIELVEQDSAYELSSRQRQRAWIDLWSGWDVLGFSRAFRTVRALEQELHCCKEKRMSAQAGLGLAEEDLAEIEEVLHFGDEAKLTEEHHRLSLAESQGERLGKIHEALSSSAFSAELTRYAQSLFAFLPEAAELLKTASLEVREAERMLEVSLDRMEFDPKRLEVVEHAIAKIERAKKKYPEGLRAHADELTAKIASISLLEDQERALQEQYNIAFSSLQKQSKALTAARKAASEELQKLLETELQSLNLPHARVEIQVQPKELNEEGANDVLILFSANPGQSLFALEECASGGERARFLFALKILFASKEQQGCLIFDEIDSNIGGKTASLLGQKLKLLSKHRQVICITHFVQVAKAADQHFLVSKISDLGQTETLVEKLSEFSRKSEYARMIGHEV